MKPQNLGAAKIYSWLLKLYPAGFREEYQTPMERQFHDDYRDAEGARNKARFWLQAVFDLVTSAPAEFVRELVQDLTHGFRVYRMRSLGTVLAIIALGLAIGVSTGVFSVLNALLFRDLPFRDSAKLAELWLSPFGAFQGRNGFYQWLHQSPYLQDAATFSSSEMNLAGDRESFRVKVAETSANFFQMLGVQPAVGRTFAASEDITGQNAVALISYPLWQQMFGGTPRIAGSILHVNGMPLTVIGVLPANFDYPGKTSVWLPTVFDFEKIPKRGAFMIQTVGRLKPGVSLTSAPKMFEAEVLRADPSIRTRLKADEQNRPRLVSLQSQLAGAVRPASWVLAGMTLLVLLTACANVAQLLLSRTTERQQELEVRAALGASRARLLQQLTTEATILTMLGALLGMFVAHWTSDITSSIAPAQLATQAYTILDWHVLTFAILLALSLAVAFGVLPTWLLGHLHPSSQVVRSRAGAGDRRAKRARGALIALQTALTLTLLSSSFVMGKTFLRLIRADLGFRTAGVVTLNVALQGTRYRGPGEWAYYSEALSRLRAVPGVRSAGAVSYLPLANNVYMAGGFKLDSGQSVSGIVMNGVTPDYFRTMDTRFLSGRDFTQDKSLPSVVVNEAFAQRAGLGREIVGRGLIASWSQTPYRIVGLVATTSFLGPAHEGGPQIYWNISEEPPAALTFVAKVNGPAEDYLTRCRDAVRVIDKGVPIYEVKTLEQRLDDALARPKFYTTAILFLAGLAMLLASIGIYGTAAYSIAQRRSEMGIRMALGATYQRIRTMMVGESLLPIACGMAAGLLGSLASGSYLAHLVESADRPELSTCLVAVFVLLCVGLFAAWSATSRVLSIAPADAIRAD